MKRNKVYLDETNYKSVVELAGLLQELEAKKVYLGEAVGRACRFMKSFLMEEGAGSFHLRFK